MRVGEGGMAYVYRAKDRQGSADDDGGEMRLSRRLAEKIKKAKCDEQAGEHGGRQPYATPALGPMRERQRDRDRERNAHRKKKRRKIYR